MVRPDALLLARTAILAMAEIKEAAEAFDRGEISVFDAMDAVVVVVEGYRASARDDRREAA